MSNTAISVENISKQYHLGVIGTGTIRDDLKVWWAKTRNRPNPLQKVVEVDHGNTEGDLLWALRDVSFKVNQGEALGIIGRNGAGKSTLLKILSRVTTPTSGEVKVRGRIASLLEVGTGFHPELTGRENVFLNGAIMGMSKNEVAKKFDEIVNFSGVERFIDTPVKRYSSGMYVRLAFAVSAHLEPDIMIVDEVLAVGDTDFQKKCLGKMGDVSHEGRTVLFVSHNMAAISTLCNRSILLKKSSLAMDGNSNEVISTYLSDYVATSTTNSLIDQPHYGNGKAVFSELVINAIDKNNQPLAAIKTNDDIVFSVNIKAIQKIKDASVELIIYDSGGYRLIDANLALKNLTLSLDPGDETTLVFTLYNVLLKQDRYMIGLWMGYPNIEDIDGILYARSITVEPNPEIDQTSKPFPGPYQCNFTILQK